MRILNLIVLFFICMGMVMVGYGVCEYIDDYGEPTYYPRVRSFLIGCSAVWGIMMVGGTLFHRYHKTDTALANPRRAVTQPRDAIDDALPSASERIVNGVSYGCYLLLFQVGP